MLSFQQLINYPLNIPNLLLSSEEVSEQFLPQVSFAFLYLPVSVSFQGGYLSCDFNYLLDLRKVVDFQFFLLWGWNDNFHAPYMSDKNQEVYKLYFLITEQYSIMWMCV